MTKISLHYFSKITHSVIFHDTEWPYIKFHDFERLEIILQYSLASQVFNNPYKPLS